MKPPAEFLSPSDAARKLGTSAKALRLYEQHGLIAPVRSAAGWRAYGPEEMRRAAEIVALRALGFSMAQIARVLDQDPQGLEQALADQQAVLEDQLCHVSARLEKVRRLREDLAAGHPPAPGELTDLEAMAEVRGVAVELPWPWGGERFELGPMRPLTYIVGPLFSGKTRLARRLAEALPGAIFLGLDRLEDGGAAAWARVDVDPDLRARVDGALAWLVEDGAVPSDALRVLLAGLEDEGTEAVICDMVEEGLDAATQQALIAYLRRRGAGARPLFLMTRSCEILDLAAVGPHEAIILCPANHSPPSYVAPHPGAPGYEAVATCLASPEVRARSAGVIAWRPPAA